ncbi:MAG: bifunctional phosphoglucose/phosphomannose isomerase [Candidatus Kerfeldbacteria bacterium]
MLDRESISKLDSQQMLSSIEVLDKQCTDAWNATKGMEFHDAYKNISNIVLFGMGGSALGIHVVKTLFSDRLNVPVEIVNDYSIPATVNGQTLAVLSSYSGTTEEVVTVSKTILEKTKNVFVVATGGFLQEFSEEQHLPAYIFHPEFNPSNQPRMAVGYSVMAILGAFTSLGLLSVTDKEVEKMASFLQQLHETLGADVPEEQNPAKKIAAEINGRLPIFISSEFLVGSTHVFTNQVNENGKCFAGRFTIPEMNHHLIEGFQQPRESLDRLLFVFITSAFYHDRNQKRYEVTRGVVEKNGIAATEIKLTGANPFIQAFELLLFGSYVSFYLAILTQTDPSPIPNVDLLKNELKKS